jgi:hypothetical protein
MSLNDTRGTRHSSKVRELYEAMRREQDGMGDDVTTSLSCESALREAGVDEALIARKLKEQLEAKQPRWNPKKKEFDLFPDHDARLAALREAVRIFGGFPAPSEDNHALLSSTLRTPSCRGPDGRVNIARQIQRCRGPRQNHSVTNQHQSPDGSNGSLLDRV